MARRNVAAASSAHAAPPSAAFGTQTPLTDRHSADYPSLSPGGSSDKENRTSAVIDTRDKGKGRMPTPGKLPTPNSDGSSEARSAKRRRLDATAHAASADDEENTPVPEGQRYYDPGQDENERREIKRKSRALERAFNENRDDYLKHDNAGLQETILEANAIFAGVKQTSDATLDSRLMVNVSDLTYKKSAQLVLGDTSTGIDVDEFVSKCILYMRQAPTARDNHEEPPASTSRRRRRRSSRDDEEEDEHSDNMLNWEILGAQACFPHNLRPAVPGFLLGPLSVQKRVRAPAQRRARQQKETGGQETRPEALTAEDMQANENNTVRTICGNIKARLDQHCRDASSAIDQLDLDEHNVAEVKAAMRKHRITTTGGPSLFDFVVNPHSFGQTVENLFYVSFLIKEGEVGVDLDDDGLPTLIATTETMHDSRLRHTAKHQAVFGLDYSTWQDLVNAFDIEEPLIPHRQTEQSTQVGARGWYG